MLEYGTFNIEDPNHPTYEYWQIPTADKIFEVDVSKLSFVPKMFILMHDDNEKIRFLQNRISFLYGNKLSNGIMPSDGGTVRAEEKSFKDTEASYVRYDEENKKLYFHVNQWATLKCGKWRWIAIGELEDD